VNISPAYVSVQRQFGFGTIDRQLNNPISLWIAAIWNGVLALGFVLMMIVGLMMRHG